MNEIRSVEDIVKLATSGFTNWKSLGNVSVKEQGDLLLFSYSSIINEWNEFEILSRGLIINKKTGEIVARPFDKFFNWGEGGRKPSQNAHLVAVMEKLDGSLGILYHDDRIKGNWTKGIRIATRGSFDSEQAIRATQMLEYYDWTDIDTKWTLMFEIIYPENRIVVNYGDTEELILLAARNRFTGEYATEAELNEIEWAGGFVTPTYYQFNNVTDIIAAAGQLGIDKEGFVLLFSDGSRWKIKGDRYLELHRLVTNISVKTTLEAMRGGQLDRYLEAIPDEFLHDVRRWRDQIEEKIETIKLIVAMCFNEGLANLSRKEFATWVFAHYPQYQAYFFAEYDGRPWDHLIWKTEDWSFVN